MINRSTFISKLTLAVAVGALLATITQATARDWPSWRGPAHNGAAYETAAVKSWTEDGENMLWKTPVGGRTTPVLLDGRLFMIVPTGSDKTLGEAVVCLDAKTGKEVWRHEFNVFLTTIVEQRVGWTAVVSDPETKNIYAHGTGGLLMCLSFDGELRWEISLTEMFNRVSGYGGRLHTPIVDEDKVIISFVSSNWGNHGPPGHRYLAVDKNNGQVIWWSKPGGKHLDTTYSVPVVSVINGVRQLIAANADGCVYGMKVRTGEMIWKYQLSKRGLNTSVIADGNLVYVTHGEENFTTTAMGAVLCIDASDTGDITETGTKWRVDGLTAGYVSPALANGRLYVVDNAATMHCFDAKTGAKNWEHECGRVGKGSPVVTSDGVIYIATVNGRFVILQDEGDACKTLHEKEFDLVDKFVVELYGSPVVADGKVYFQTRYNTYCLGKAVTTIAQVPVPKLADEAGASNTDVGSMLVVPADVTLDPNGQAQFQLRYFTANAQPIQFSNPPEFKATVKGVSGKFNDADMSFTADDANAYSAGVIEFESQGQKATARVRVCQRLPISVNFDEFGEERNPSGWAGLGIKTQLTDLDGEKVLHKVASKKFPSVPFMRMRSYSNPPIDLPKGYTVQCDMMGQKRPRGRKVLPDMGLINTRYTIKLMGQLDKLRIESWSPIPRIRQDVDWKMEPGTWYRVKLRVEQQGKEAWVRGKVWPRDQEEPADWQVEMRDPRPNTEGSPGLYAYSNGTKHTKDGPPIYFDNYRVFANE